MSATLAASTAAINNAAQAAAQAMAEARQRCVAAEREVCTSPLAVTAEHPAS